jgi:hypothetical protein
MGMRRAHPPRGGRFALTAAALVALALLVGLPETAISTFATASPMPGGAGATPLQGSLPCPDPVTSSGSSVSFCATVQNTGAPPQTVTGNENSAAGAIQLDIANSPVVQVTYQCTTTQVLVGYVVFDMDLLGATVVHSPYQLKTSTNGGTGTEDYQVCTPGTYYETRVTNISLAGLSTWDYALSGVYDGKIYLQDENGSQVGGMLSFFVNVVPAVYPVTYFTIPLMLIVVYELYQVARDFRNLQRSRPARQPPAEAAAPPPTGPGPATPPGGPIAPGPAAPIAAPPSSPVAPGAPPTTAPPRPAPGSPPPSAPPSSGAPPMAAPRPPAGPPVAPGGAGPSATVPAGPPANRPPPGAAPSPYVAPGPPPTQSSPPPAYPGANQPPPAPGTSPNSPWRGPSPAGPGAWGPPPGAPTGPPPASNAPSGAWTPPPPPVPANVPPGPPLPAPPDPRARRPGDPPAPGGSA